MQSQSQQFRYQGPALIAATAAVMLSWSWGTWPDPLVDFGAQLYVPWQLSTGHVLYRDIAYYNGPLSSYLNCLAFLLGGVSLRTLVFANLMILAATMIVAYRLTVRAAGRITAVMGGLTFILMFAFGQTVLIGNYNWVTPYTHEITHGVALGLAAIACANRYQRTGKSAYMIATGALLGAVFLTKAEPTAASGSAVGVMLLAGWWGNRTSARTIVKSVLLMITPALAVPIIAAALLTTAMPVHQAIAGVLGSWPWVFDRRITSLAFYRKVTGLDLVTANLVVIFWWSLGYLIVLGSGICLGFVLRRHLGRFIAFAIAAGGLLWGFRYINWTGMFTPLPLCVAGAALLVAVEIIHRRGDPARSALKVGLVLFALVLLAKMGLKPHLYHYGFVLAWPGTIVLIAAVAEEIPVWIGRHGGSGWMLRTIGLLIWTAAVIEVLNQDAINFRAKRWTLAAGTPDAFRVNSCGLEVQKACEEVNRLVPADGTVAVFPQGLMINYLTRRQNPLRSVNFMPPEVLAAGESSVIESLKQHPPGVIIITSSVVQNWRFTVDGRDDYGKETLRWITQHFYIRDVVKLPPPLPTIYRFMVSLPNKGDGRAP